MRFGTGQFLTAPMFEKILFYKILTFIGEKNLNKDIISNPSPGIKNLVTLLMQIYQLTKEVQHIIVSLL